MIATKVESQPCYINLTKRAKSDVNDILGSKDEFLNMPTDKIIQHVLSSQNSFLIHIEKATGKTEEDLYVHLHFNTTENKGVMKYLKDQTFSLYGVVKNDGLLVIGINFLPYGLGQPNNRRITSTLHFFVDERHGTSFPVEILEAIKSLPVGREQSQFVKSRLESWEVYLDMIMEKEKQNEVTMDFHSARLTEHLRELNINCPSLKGQVAHKDLRGAVVTLLWEDDGIDEVSEKIGTVRRFDFDKNILEVELEEDYVELARQNKWSPARAGKVHISNHGGLVQAKRLRKGFSDLQNGVAKNPNLEYLLFEENPVIDTSSNVHSFEFKEAIQDNLNPYQRAAVKGALAAEDIYLIQGPPGTGKTTVIAEICYQNVERGLKTLVASQSNLAVDNALSKLLTHPKVRILRKGNTKSIEEEGKTFIEENVAETWKKQTLESIQLDIKEIDCLIEEKKGEIKENENDLTSNAEKLAELEKEPKIRMKLLQIQNNLRQFQDQETRLNSKREKCELLKKELEQRLQKNSKETAQLSVILNNWKENNVYKEKMAALRDRINSLHVEIEYLEAQTSFHKAVESHQALVSSLEELDIDIYKIEDSLMGIPQMIDVEIISFIDDESIESPEISQKQKSLSESIRMVNLGESGRTQLVKDNENYLKLEEQLDMVMVRQKKILVGYGYDTELAEVLGTANEYLPKDLMQLIPHLANRRMSFSEPSYLQNVLWKVTKKLPKQVEILIEEYNQSVAAKKLLKETLENNEIQIVEIREAKNKLPLLAAELKNLLYEYYKELEVKAKKQIKDIHVDMISAENYVEKCNQLFMKQRTKLDGEEPSTNVSNLKLLLNTATKELNEFGTEDQYKKKLTLQKQESDFAINNSKVRLKEITQEIEMLSSKLLEIQLTLEDLGKKVEEKRRIVDHFKNINIEKEKIKIDKKNKFLKQKMDSLEKHITTYLNQRIMKVEWSNMLKDAKDYDLREIKKLYIKHANVIGITCVQSAKKDFAIDYPDFDVVIIDEVSKATPPELLLPMLKGKKVILVGDHHQLPPLIGQETLDEVVDKISSAQKKDEVRTNLQESLFERLFKSLPEQYKSTLRIQYRMHEDIMETITQFYEEESETGYGLSCGLENSNRERDHNLDGQYIKRGQHIMWFDIPHEEEFFETKEKGMTSPYNGAELKIISELLIDLNTSVEIAKQEGRILENTMKSVGIISFYGEQVRRLRHLVDDMKLEHLKFRVGTVDRFQGMESEIIIASFVRNHIKKEEDIGFANDYRRLNVALSRAKELLIVTGSLNMFTVKAKRSSSRKMYKRVSDTVRLKNGLRDHKGRVK